MIGIKEARWYCKDDISLIENYAEAVASPERWDCHHRWELTVNGEPAHTPEELKKMDMYYHRPYFELVFLKHSDHQQLHIGGEKNPNFGKPRSAEVKLAVSAANTGNQYWKGKHHTEESKAKISAAKMGHTVSAETKAKLKGRIPWTKGKKGKPLSTEQKAKISATLKGHTVSADSRAKRSATMKATLAKKKNLVEE